jgi:predicted phosphodiesterase
MKIKLVSDLHLEFSDITIDNEHNYDLLILGGDIMIAQNLHEFKADDPILPMSFSARDKAKRFRNFLKSVSQEFPHVIYIAGNHEFYHGKYPDAYNWLRKECDVFNNIYFLEMGTKEIDHVVFIGATLWTDMNKGNETTFNVVKNIMNDYKVIRNSDRNYAKLSPYDTVIRHKKTLEYIRQVINIDPNKKYVVVGHHAPSKLSIKPKYANDIDLNGAYSSDLSEFINNHPQIKLWTHGHTHDTYDYMIGATRIVCNPRGYEGYEEDSGWNPEIILEV